MSATPIGLPFDHLPLMAVGQNLVADRLVDPFLDAPAARGASVPEGTAASRVMEQSRDPRIARAHKD
jgi:hypothetical protein